MVFAEVLRIQRRVHVGAGAHDSPFVRLFSGRRGADPYRDDVGAWPLSSGAGRHACNEAYVL